MRHKNVGGYPKAPLDHNYMKKILNVMTSPHHQQREGGNHIIVAHDKWCGVYNGNLCNCDPEITFCEGSG